MSEERLCAKCGENPRSDSLSCFCWKCLNTINCKLYKKSKEYAEKFEGKFAILRHENNKLRAENRKLKEKLNEDRS